MIDENESQRLADDIYQHYLTAQLSRPFFICIAGPVGSGKSTMAIQLQKMFLQLDLNASVVSTDNFLLRNADLDRLNIKKGSSRSYDGDLINRFFSAAKLRQPVSYPLYQHHNYDRDPSVQQHLPLDLHMLIVEGVNVCSLIAAGQLTCDAGVYVLATRSRCIEAIISRTQNLFRLHAEAKHPFKEIWQNNCELRKAVINNWQHINQYTSWSHKPRLMQLIDYYVDHEKFYPNRFFCKYDPWLIRRVVRNLYWRVRLRLAMRR